jgi:hypothetical protein
MRIVALAAVGLLAACTTNTTVPSDQVLYEVTPGGTGAPLGATGAPLAGTSLSAGGDAAFVGGEGDVAGPLPDAGTPLDDDVLNLTLYTIERQKVDARIAERELAEARSQLVVMQPEPVPDRPQDVNIAVFARQAQNAVGERVYQRAFIPDRLQTRRTCSRFANADAAQRAFLTNGGPVDDVYNLDPDGDGFACDWSPEPYRSLSF